MNGNYVCGLCGGTMVPRKSLCSLCRFDLVVVAVAFLSVLVCMAVALGNWF